MRLLRQYLVEMLYTNITAPITITAQWTAIQPTAHAITINGGTANLATATAGQSVSITANTPPAGQRFSHWTASPAVTFANANTTSTTFTMPNNAVTITAVFVPIQVTTPSDPSPTYAWLHTSQATFDRANPQDITITLYSGDFSFRNIRFNNVALVRDRDFTVTSNRYTISAEFLSTLEVGQRRLTFEMSGGSNPTFTITVIDTTPASTPQPTPDPTPQPTSAPILPTVRVELSQALTEELAEILSEAFYDLVVDVVASAADEVDGGFVIADITLSLADEALNDTLNNQLPRILQAPNAYIAITADLSDFVDVALNHHRIVAIHNGRIIGGNFDVATGYFTVTGSTTGEFTIAYVETLMRLALQIGSPIIHDLAGNTPAQFMDVVPLIQDSRTLIPIRFIAEALGAEVDWISGTPYAPPIAIIIFDGRTLSFPIGEMTPELQALGMDVPAQVMSGRTMVPLRFVSEFFGAVVTWGAEAQGIEIILAPTTATAQNPTPMSGTDTQTIAALAREDEDEAAETTEPPAEE